MAKHIELTNIPRDIEELINRVAKLEAEKDCKAEKERLFEEALEPGRERLRFLSVHIETLRKESAENYSLMGQRVTKSFNTFQNHLDELESIVKQLGGLKDVSDR